MRNVNKAKALRVRRLFPLAAFIAAAIFVGSKSSSPLMKASQLGPADMEDSRLLEGFAKVQPIDVHTHIYKDDPGLNALVQRLDLRTVNITVIDDRDPDFEALEPQRTEVLKVRRSTHGRLTFCTTFSPYGFEEPGFEDRTVEQLNGDFGQGALAVKIYKVMGMEMKNRSGKWVMADNPAFERIYRDIASHDRTLIAHLAEPDSCWQPPNPASPDYAYYKEHPGEYAYAHPDWPTKAAILAARDRVVAENPQLRVVGAHLGSMETNVDDIARRFDLYPNFAVDMAARVPYLMLQPRDKVRSFLLKYQDRVLYATDLVVFPRSRTEDTLREFRKTYARDWKFFSTDQEVEYLGHTYQGLNLPPGVLRKLFHDNAVRWFPGVDRGTL
jgi:predicted TIM-barrel fold metal-dependent hydrolase